MPKGKPPAKPFTSDDPRINRKGRPKGVLSATESLKRILAAECKVTENGKEVTKTNLDLVTYRIFKDALAGDATSKKLIMQYLDGMPKQTIEATMQTLPDIKIEFGDDKDK